MKAAPSEPHNREIFFSSVNRDLQRLDEFVRHQLRYFESTGDLMPGELSPEDVIDAVLLRGYREFVKGGGRPEIGNWLIELATEHIGAQVKRLKAEHKREVHLEEDIPETPPAEEVSTLGEEIFDFYQPDEDLKLEDVFPDFDISTPEDFVAAKEELLHCVNAALAGLPKEWRRALHLRHQEHLTSEELSEALDKAEPEIERILEYAREHLRQNLKEAGCRFILKESNEQGAKRKAQRAKS